MNDRSIYGSAAMSPIDLLSNIATVFGASFLVFLPLELWKRKTDGTLNWKSFAEMAASTSPLLGVIALNGLVMAFIAGFFTFLSALVPWAIETTLLSAAICLVLTDFLYFTDHYCGHRFRFYWAISHSVHHSSPQFDQTTALRISAVDGFTSPWFLALAVFLGFDPLLILACYGVVLAYQQWIHTETIGKLGTFDAIFNSPSNHRVHHGSDDIYLDRNYGGILIIWDRVFKTYQHEDKKPTYGLVTPIDSMNPINVHLHEARNLWRDVRASRSWREVLHHVFARPGEPFVADQSSCDAK
jgi:sterol desaturase/sphingolipid hydroxylase (fatty acid hydroxylase superfamily)